MTRLSEHALQLVKNEIDRRYPVSESPASQAQNVERMILLARLETLHQSDGKSLTQAQLWEEVCDILPHIDRKVLKQAGRAQIGTQLVGPSVGIGVAGMGVAAVLLSNPLNAGIGPTDSIGETNTASPLQVQAFEKAAQAQTSHHQSTFETAKGFGWRAALKGQNPPHSAQHWGETAALWQQAINLLNQVPRHDGYYAIAQTKKAEYQQNLQQIQSRQLAAQNLAAPPTPKFSQPRPKVAVSPQVPQLSKPEAAQEDFLAIAKGHGWQAALASQNAPHPTEKWVTISRLWQLAIQNLNKIESDHPSYPEALLVRAQYEENLAAIRQRYRIEQDASQQLQSLQATLIELESAPASSRKQAQIQAVINRLSKISPNTVAHQQAQQVIASTGDRLKALSTQIAISTEEEN
ncbi:MAG: hypothetical protein AAFR25_02800 [Cyanobacteria bacterium J06629_19]